MLQFVEFAERPAALAAMNIRGEEAKEILKDPLLYQKKAINLMTDGAADLMSPDCFAYTESLIIREDQLNRLIGAQLRKLRVLTVHIENVGVRERLVHVFKNIEHGLTNYWERVNFPALETLVIFFPAAEGHHEPFSLALNVFKCAGNGLKELHVEGKGFAFNVDTSDNRGLAEFFRATRPDGRKYCDQIERFRATFYPEDIPHVTSMNGLKEYVAAGLWMESLPLIEKMPHLETFTIFGRSVGTILYPQRIVTRYPGRGFTVRIKHGMIDWRDKEVIAANQNWRSRFVFDPTCRETHESDYWRRITILDGWRTLDDGAHQLVANPARVLSWEEDDERGRTLYYRMMAEELRR